MTNPDELASREARLIHNAADVIQVKNEYICELETAAATLRTALAAASERERGLRDALEAIARMTNVDDPESYRSDDLEGCLDTVYACAQTALARTGERGEGDGD